MNWLTDLVKPKIQALIKKREIPDNLWTKCPKCEHMLFQRDLQENKHVCHYCQHHMRMPARERLSLIYDDGQFTEHHVPPVIADPLKFKDTKKYADRIKDYRAKTNRQDSIIVAHGTIGGLTAVAVLFDFDFMGGSMGLAAGKGLVIGADLACSMRAPLIAITASGGARMQEGILSLMQLPRTTIAVEKVKEAGLPYITLLTDPTTGGVSASFAMLGDVAIAEPGAVIGFAGARVLEETLRHKLPEGFQKAEFLLEHGMVDMVVHRHKLHETLAKLFKHVSHLSKSRRVDYSATV
jgi:acetyl-CoA carboxylase carboxyl transferase subunit beta